MTPSILVPRAPRSANDARCRINSSRSASESEIGMTAPGPIDDSELTVGCVGNTYSAVTDAPYQVATAAAYSSAWLDPSEKSTGQRTRAISIIVRLGPAEA